MKDISVIKEEMSQLLKNYKEALEKTEYNKIKSRLGFLKTCLFYLESKPDFSYLQKEKKRLKERIDKIEKNFKYFNAPLGVKGDIKKYYRKQYGVPVLKQQIKTIDFLLN